MAKTFELESIDGIHAWRVVVRAFFSAPDLTLQYKPGWWSWWVTEDRIIPLTEREDRTVEDLIAWGTQQMLDRTARRLRRERQMHEFLDN